MARRFNKKAIFGVVFVLLIGVALAFSLEINTGGASEEKKKFAQCLTDKGAKFYGAYWCPHCKRQKHLFGDAMENINYIECSPNGRNEPMAQVCRDANIQSFPTWIVEGKRYSGVLSLQRLGSITGCKPP